MNQAVGLDQGPHPVAKEILIDPAPLGFMIFVVLDCLIAQAWKKPRHPSPHPGHDQLGMLGVVAHHMKLPSRRQPLFNRCVFPVIDHCIAVAAQVALHARIVGGKKPPEELQMRTGIRGHRDHPRTVINQCLNNLGRYRIVHIKPSAPPWIHQRHFLRVEHCVIGVLRVVTPQAEADHIPLRRLRIIRPERRHGQRPRGPKRPRTFVGQSLPGKRVFGFPQGLPMR